MATLYAQVATNWTLALWNTQANGLGTPQNPTSADTAECNGLAITWDQTLDGAGFTNALAITNVNGGTFTWTGGTISITSNLTINAADDGTSTTSIGNGAGGLVFTFNANISASGVFSSMTVVIGVSATFSGSLTASTDCVLANNGTISGAFASYGVPSTNNGTISGTVMVNAGTLTNASTGVISNTITVASGVFNNNSTTAISSAVTLNGGTFNNSAVSTLGGGVTFSGTNATLNNAGTIGSTAITMSGTGDVFNNTGTIQIPITVNAGEAFVNNGGVFSGGSLTFNGGLVRSNTDIHTALSSNLVPAGGVLLIEAVWSVAMNNDGVILDAVNGGSGVTLGSGNPIITLPIKDTVIDTYIYSVAGFGPTGTAGVLTGNFVIAQQPDVRLSVHFGPNSSLVGSYALSPQPSMQRVMQPIDFSGDMK